MLSLIENSYGKFPRRALTSAIVSFGSILGGKIVATG